MGLADVPETAEIPPTPGAPQNSTGSINAAEARTRGNATAKAFQIVIAVFPSVPPAESCFGRLFPRERWHDLSPPSVTAVTRCTIF